jgi:hypothetical protein
MTVDDNGRKRINTVNAVLEVFLFLLYPEEASKKTFDSSSPRRRRKP